MKKLLLLTLLAIINIHCNSSSKNSEANIIEVATPIDTRKNDSIALLDLTKRVYLWDEETSKLHDFKLLQHDSIYTGLDLPYHKKRLNEIASSNLFTAAFLANYDKIALTIDQEFKDGILEWKTGELPPFGNGSNAWCNCQDKPDAYLDKMWIMQLEIKNNIASYTWSWGDGLVYTVKASKTNQVWKIMYLEGFDYQYFTNTFQRNNDYTGKWENGMVTLDIGEKYIAFEYHGQCVYFYPIHKISATEFEMIWSGEMDCKFDNGTNEDFGLENIPKIGEAFSKITVTNKVLHVDYYFEEWVAMYAAKVQTEVFTPEYYKKIEIYN